MQRDPIRTRFRIFSVAFLIVLITGTIGFMVTEKLNLSDAFYFSVVTISTVGYGDVHPTRNASKALAIFLIVMGVGTFLGAVGNATELALNKREKMARLEKLNMVIGAFFSEVGRLLLEIISNADRNLESIRNRCLIKTDSSDEQFGNLEELLKNYKSDIQGEKIELEGLTQLLTGKKDFLLRLLENPNLLENESFTDVLWAVFHLSEELGFRKNLSALPDTDRQHLLGDINRVYNALIIQWVEYMRHLKNKYPYLFSLSIRTNPFDKDASPVVR